MKRVGFAERIMCVSLVMLMLSTIVDSSACTSAVVGAKATRDGRPLLWKHRDTSSVDNKVEYIPSEAGEYAYVALFDASDRKCEQAWIGMNEVGFAVMNTASYNIKDDDVPQQKMDREGYLMSLALKSCRTIDDFAYMLDNMPRPMGVEANFGVIDAEGGGAYFETNNYGYVRFNVEDAPGSVLIRTNHSHSGRKGEGYGQIRESNAEHLLCPYIDSHSITPEVLTEILSRSFYHDLLETDYSSVNLKWVVDQDFIPRYKSTATVVVEGMIPVEDALNVTAEIVAEQYIMWVGLGYPPCSEILPVWCCENGVDNSLRGISEEGHSPMSDSAKMRRDDVFSAPDGNSDKYIDMTKLFNSSGTGYVQILTKLNRQTYQKTRNLRDAKNKCKTQTIGE